VVKWRLQVKKAHWMEERFITGLARHIGAKVSQHIGAKIR
jgi:hypothetical protein